MYVNTIKHGYSETVAMKSCSNQLLSYICILELPFEIIPHGKLLCCRNLPESCSPTTAQAKYVV